MVSSWGTNNGLGDALNIEFVHAQLFFIEGEQVLENIGYGEKGKRFREEQYGKPIRTLADLAKNGYWLVGRRFCPEAAREALAEVDDGCYYSFFSKSTSPLDLWSSAGIGSGTKS